MKITFLETTPNASLFPPIPSKKMMPEWYKELPAELPMVDRRPWNTNFSAKRCMPLQDFMTSGYILTNHVDIGVVRHWDPQTGEHVHFDFKRPDSSSAIEFHDADQMPVIRNGFPKRLCKFAGTWGIQTPPGYSCLFYQPEYFLETRWRILPAIVDTDQFHTPVNFPFLLSDSFEAEERYFIQAGTPLVAVIPFKRDSWQHELKKFDPANDRSSILMKTIWDNIYRRFMHSKKNFD
jgi:hypothetical protein